MGRRSREKAGRRRDAPRASEELHAPARGATPPSAPPDFAWRDHVVPIVTLFALAFAYRTAVLVQLAGTPYLEVTNVDSGSYQKWALELVNGTWWPARIFYQSPFYAYFLAAIYEVAGTGPWAPRIVQILLGSASPAVLYAIGALLFSRRVGWIAGIALAFYGPIVLEEITLSKTSPLVFTALAGFAAYVYSAPRTRLGGLAFAGFLFGISIVGVAQWLLAFVVLCVYASYLAAGAPARRRRLAVAVFAGAGLATIVPVVTWNSIQGGGLVLTSGGAGLNLYSGNNPRARGLPAVAPGVRDTPEYEEEDARRVAERDLGHPLRQAEVDRYWSGRAFAFMREHPDDFVALLAEKLLVLWNAYEIPDNYHYAFMRRHFLSSLWLGVTFGLVGPLALVGLVIPYRRRGAVWALYLVLFAYLVTPVVYYVRSRYRLPAVPFLILFGAVAVEHFVSLLAAQRWPAIAGWSAALLAAGVFVNHEYCEPAHDGLRSTCLARDTWFDLEWKRLAEWYQHQGDHERELAYVERALECSSPRNPGDTSLWIAFLESRKAAAFVADGKQNDGTASFRRAEQRFRETIALGHRTGYAQAELAALYTTMSMHADAVQAYEAARASGMTDRKTLLRLGAGYVALGRCADASGTLAEADRVEQLATPSTEVAAILARCEAR